jgi:hypothetical protein
MVKCRSGIVIRRLIDYQDFSGDPAGSFTLGGEAFGDASSIAAQDMPNGKPLNFDISKFVNAAHPLASPCNIRIRGMAPGASLVGLPHRSFLKTPTGRELSYASLRGAPLRTQSSQAVVSSPS